MGDIRVCEQGCSIRLQDLEYAIVRRVPTSPKEPWQLETSQAVKVLPKKRNWNTPGPDRFHKLLVEVWAFLAISESEEEYPGLAEEISCLWMEHQEKKSKEKTVKYGPLLFELKKQYPSCDVDRCNIIIDVPGGWSRDL